MRIRKQKIEIESRTQIDFMNITDLVQEAVDNSGIRDGQVLVYAPHTTMGVVVNHNEPMLIQDFMRLLYRIAPIEDQYSHDLFELRRGHRSDGRSNGHSHCKSLLTGVNVTIPIEHGKLMLADKQAIFALDFDGARKRDLWVQTIGL
ncbi:YjbQ family protein [Patescibacteria group bacterium]|nr:MAG: YjbQ family protein [Patescibacteria group bacterium]